MTKSGDISIKIHPQNSYAPAHVKQKSITMFEDDA